MKLPDSIAAAFRTQGASPTEPAPYDFDRISSYFYHVPAQDARQTIDAETTSDLDLNAVFERIDRTTSKVGQQYLYARLRTLRGQAEVLEFSRCADHFEADQALAARCSRHLKGLADEDAYDFCNLIFEQPAQVRYIRAAYPLSIASAALLCLSFFYPVLLLLFVVVFAANLFIHYSNKLNISLYVSAVKQLSKGMNIARSLAAEAVPGAEDAQPYIRRTAQVERRSRIVSTQGEGGNELTAIFWFFIELLKVTFNIEVILFHRFMGSIAECREAIHGIFRLVGDTDAAIAVMRLRQQSRTCRPVFTDKKYLQVKGITHPLLADCVANTLTLDGTGLLLTGSNMSGKTTFIRTLTLNALLAETLCTCFAEAYTAPYMKLFSSIHISDDLAQGASYYLQEVKSIKKCLDASREGAPCLFALDELFKGTNTTERISAGKAVLSYLNLGPHLVLISTHDTELTELLDGSYALYHFREEVAGQQLVFDYRLHAGPLTTRNAIRILELYGYPAELTREAYEVQQKLLKQKPD